jgi:hypothetical protein
MDETYEVIEQPEDKRGGKPAPLVDAAAVAGAGDFCARCGKAMGASSVVCTHCGLDLRTGQTAAGGIPGVARKAEAERTDTRPALCDRGPEESEGATRSAVRVMLWAAAIMALSGALMAAIFLKGDVAWWVRPAKGLLILLSLGIHTLTGLGGLYLAALWIDHRVGDLELAVGRMAACVGVFLAVLFIPLGAGGFSGVLSFLLASAAYVATACVLFGKKPAIGGRVALMHFGVAAVVQLGLTLYGLVAAASVGK